ncbi:toprim domain-containing protein [Patescibacteria group bacterium]|nr:toprim domain-containing protein [Patescibacteria group bacterium]
MNLIDSLTEKFSKLPGIGPRQSKRFVYFLLTKDRSYLKELAENILNLKDEVKVCKSCYRFFNNYGGATSVCDICFDNSRDNSVLMVVGKDADMENIEKNHIYNGKYFILGGYLPIMNDNAPWVRSKELMKLIEKKSEKEELKEVILALSLSPEGENTIHYIMQILEPLRAKFGLKITTLGKGLSTGTELEYSDDDTLKNALKNRS